MAKNAMFTMRINPDMKREAEELFHQFGMTLSEAVTIFLHQAVLEQGLPFEVKLNNRAIEEKTAQNV